MDRTIKIALVGAGMFGGDVHLRAYADLQRFGIAGQLARLGLDKHSRDFADVKFELVAVATKTEASGSAQFINTIGGCGSHRRHRLDRGLSTPVEDPSFL